MTTFVTTHNVLHNTVEYPAGSPITLDENDAEQAATIAHLRAHKAIALAVELQAAEDVQKQLDDKEKELADLRAELAAAREAAATATSASTAPTPKAAKAAPASVAPASMAPGPVEGSQQPVS